MMDPVLLEGLRPHYHILHKCTRCGAQRVNPVSHKDSTKAIIRLARNPHPPLGIEIDTRTGVEFDPLAQEKNAPLSDKGSMESNIRREESG